MSHISVQGEQSTLTEINALAALTALPTDITKAIVKSGASSFSQVSIGAGTGDVVGPASATDNALAVYDGTTGELLKDSIIKLVTTVFSPVTSDGVALGSGTLMWSDLFLASGGVINFNNGNVTLTHSAGILTLGGTATLALGSNSLTMTGSIAATGARVTKGWFTDIESTNMPTVGGTSLSSTFQALDADLTSWAGVTRASGFDTFAATPSSANLISLVTDETGTGALVFANTPTLVTPVLGAATGTSLNLNGGQMSHTIAGATVTSTLEVHSEGATDIGALTIHRHTDTAAFGANFLGIRSNGTHASPTIVASGDAVVRFAGAGFDGTDYALMAEIRYEIDGTPGNNDMPGRIVFLTTADGAGSTTERMRISNAGAVNIAGLTASEIVITDASKNLVSAAVATYPSLTELTYVKGVTSAIQTQLNAKQATLTLGTGVETALGINVGSAGAFVTFNGALGTPSSGTVTNLTGTASININGTVGATSPTTATFTTATINTGLVPDANDGAYLGQAGTAFSDLFLAEGGVINWDSGDLTLTQTGNLLALAGGQFTFGANTAYFAETDNGNSSTADTIDWTLSNKQKSTLTGNCTFTFTAPGGPCSLVLKLVQDATGSRTVTWPAAVHWSGGTAPTLTTTANKVDIITFYYDGTTYFGNSSLNYTA